MSQEHLWAALGRSKLDLAFNAHLFADLAGALRAAHYELTSEEIEFLRQSLHASAAAAPAGPPLSPEDVRFQREKMQERLSAQVARNNDLGAYTVCILKETLNNARSAYHRITLMNSIMFFTGIALFIAAAIYGAVSKDTAYALVLASLGAANFVALFVLGPVEHTQNALSNLVQVEVAFMNYFEQITFWETYALTPTGNPPAPNPANIKEASEHLQQRSQETIVLLQTYVEAARPRGLPKGRTAAESA